MTIGPSGDDDQVSYLLAVTRESVHLLSNQTGFTVGGVRDIRSHVERASKGLLLSPEDLREVLDTVQATQSLRRGFFRIQSVATTYPLLAEFAETLADQPGLQADLSRTVGTRGEILDTASEQLGQIRREVKLAQRRLMERLNRMIAESGASGAIQDPIVTMRDGRYVIPVRADRRSQVPGVVHGTSASGQTLFVEPLAVVELNNRWREGQMAEEHEIERILRRLSDQIGAIADDLLRSVDAVAALDLAFAKARLAFDMRATEPEIVSPGEPRRVELVRARHPLLDPATVVPIDVRLGTTFRVLVVTGPNTGGKTVALKTVGLLAMMAQAGLFIPASSGSVLSVFTGIYADVGDEQSIEQSLSTFSSHMTRIIAMLREADEASLILIDEIAAGTDPQEGAALARAIIRALLERGSLAIVTTHYSELKAFAYTTEGTENASAEFDDETLAPTYRLITGVPGRSNALAIATRLGLEPTIVDEARTYLAPESQHAEDMLSEIQRRRAAADASLLEARTERERAKETMQAAEEALREAERIRTEARREALAELEYEVREIRDSLRRARPVQSDQRSSVTSDDIERARAETREAERELRQITRRRQQSLAPAQQFRLGDWVEVPALGFEGEIIGFSDDLQQADLQAGAFKVRQPLSALRKAARSQTTPSSRRARVTTPRPQRVEQELHLRGMRAGDVEAELDQYLDAAALASLPWVRVVHGKGTGALRKAVHEALRRHPLVSTFELAEASAGGDGVTVVHLKE